MNNKTQFWVTIVLIMLYVTIALACDLVAFKPVQLFDGYYIVGSAFLFMALYAMIDAIAQLNSRSFAIAILVLHMICDGIFTFSIYGIIHLPSPTFWVHQPDYKVVLDPMARLYWSGLLGSFVSGILDIWIFTQLRKCTQGRFFFLNSVISSISTVIIYTAITDTFAFRSYFGPHFMEILVVNMISNVTTAVIYSALAAILVWWVGRLSRYDQLRAQFR